MKTGKQDIYITYVEKLFIEVFSKYIKDDKKIKKLFKQVVNAYSGWNRHYHNMQHLYNVINSWNTHKHLLKDRDAVFIAAIYHDIIYRPIKKDNEDKSAAYFLNKVVPHLNLHFEKISKIKDAIYCTKHTPDMREHWENDKDIQFLLDFDLEILGTQNESEYEWYRKGVRKEYRIFPLKLYKSGRKTVLESFLKREKIYLTEEFKKIEKKARKNLQNEINNYLC